MNLYKIWQDENRGWDTYSSAVVAAKTEDQARLTHPDGEPWNEKGENLWKYDWASHPSKVHVLLIGTAVEGTKSGVIVASFNAG